MPRLSRPNVDPTVDVGIVCALELEAAPIIRRMSRRVKTVASGFTVVRGVIAGRRVAVVRSDAGRRRLASAVDALLTVHRPKWLIAAGFAVGLDPQMRRGDILVASEVVNDAGERQSATEAMVAVARRLEKVKVGRLVAVAAVPRSAAAKRGLSAKSAAVAADQHSLTSGRISSERGVPFSAVRVLVDDATRDAAPESRAVYHPSASFRAGGVFGAFMSGSGHVAKIWKIRVEANRHAERLAEFLARLIPAI